MRAEKVSLRMRQFQVLTVVQVLFVGMVLAALQTQSVQAADMRVDTTWRWEEVETEGEPTKRHECSFVECGGRFYLIGGRRENAVDRYDPVNSVWSQGAKPPLEIHHFQAVTVGSEIYVVGAMTGPYPKELPVDRVLIYDTLTDQWSDGPQMPEGRRRGGGGAVLIDGKIYLVCGIELGHFEGTQPWLDCLDVTTGAWTSLTDAPRGRDHFQAVAAEGKLYALGGRVTSKKTNHVFDQTVAEVDVYDVASNRWETLDAALSLPTPRAGAACLVAGEQLLVIGGESQQPLAHADVEILNLKTLSWTSVMPMTLQRHGTGAVWYDGKIYLAAGNDKRGGGSELSNLICFSVDSP